MDSLLIEQFQEIVLHNLDLFCLKISTDQLCAFSDYYQLILKWNNYLPLTTLISPEDFALKNILESGFAVPHIKPAINQVLDIGSGSGLPGIPIAILRPDLIITLVEANKKKAIFLKEAAAKLLLKNLIVLNQRFEDIETVLPDFCITSRAIDKFSQLLPRVMNLSASGGQILLFCNEDLLQKIKITLHLNWEGHSYLIPGSDRRLLISLSPSL